MINLKQVLVELASSELPILLIGEHGVGKHLVARQFHDASPRANCPFIEFSCLEGSEAALREAFAQGTPSTLYLDRVESLTAALQRVLLACLEADSGAKRWPHVIASATGDLETLVRTGRFREDLYYELSGVCVPIAPLRYRRDDINLLAEQYLGKYAAQFSRPKPELTPQLLRFLHAHPWTGNLPELEDAMRTVVAVGNVRVAITALRSSSPAHNRERRNGTEQVSLKQVARAASQRAQRELILRVLSRTNWNRKRAAEELRISYKAMLYKLKEIGSVPGVRVGSGEKAE